jgi:predicted transcriptional regulator
MVQLTDDLIAMLDQRAAREGVSRSQVIREAIVAFFESDRSAAIDRQLVDGYTRMPQGGAYDADEWGDMATEVVLDEDDGMPVRCVVSLDNLGDAWKAMLTGHVTTLGPDRMREVCQALSIAVGCGP